MNAIDAVAAAVMPVVRLGALVIRNSTCLLPASLKVMVLPLTDSPVNLPATAYAAATSLVRSLKSAV